MANLLLSEELLRVHAAALDGGLDPTAADLAGKYTLQRLEAGDITQLQEVKLAFCCFADGYTNGLPLPRQVKK